jgi:hypothetical protein
LLSDTKDWSFVGESEQLEQEMKSVTGELRGKLNDWIVTLFLIILFVDYFGLFDLVGDCGFVCLTICGVFYLVGWFGWFG